MNDIKKVMILSVKAGAGHLRAAEALAQVIQEEYPHVELSNIEALEYTNAAFRRSFTSAYNKLASDLPSVWGFIYEQMEKKSAQSKAKKLATLFDKINSRRILKAVEEFDPDRIICTHYFPAEILASRRRKGRLRAPVFVTLTDYDIHTMWIQDGVDHYFVATGEMEHALRAKGIGSARVSVTGIPLMPVFSAQYPAKDTMRRRLDLRTAVPTVLVAAGGFGLGHTDEAVAALADAMEDVQVLALSGKNEKLLEGLKRAAASRPGKIVPFGFVTNMHELMAASDLMVTKSGGLTSGECLAMGLPMVILKPIPGQEERNADYLLENGVAVKANSFSHLVYKVRALLADRNRLARMKAAARRIGRPRAACDIVAEVMKE